MSDAERVLREALENYGEHHPSCRKGDHHSGDNITEPARKWPCTCGLDDLLRAPQQPEDVIEIDEDGHVVRAPQQPPSGVRPIDVRAPVDGADLPPCVLCHYGNGGAYVQRGPIWICGKCDQTLALEYNRALESENAKLRELVCAQPPSGDVREACLGEVAERLELARVYLYDDHGEFCACDLCRHVGLSITTVDHLSRHMPAQPCVDVEELYDAIAPCFVSGHWKTREQVEEIIRSHVTDAAAVGAEALEEAAQRVDGIIMQTPDKAGDGAYIATLIRAMGEVKRG